MIFWGACSEPPGVSPAGKRKVKWRHHRSRRSNGFGDVEGEIAIFAIFYAKRNFLCNTMQMQGGPRVEPRAGEPILKSRYPSLDLGTALFGALRSCHALIIGRKRKSQYIVI